MTTNNLIKIVPNISLIDLLSTTDWLVFCLVFILTIAAIIYGQFCSNKKSNQHEQFLDHLLLGRQLTSMFIATLVATWYGGIFGVTEIAFTSGIYNFITQGLFGM